VKYLLVTACAIVTIAAPECARATPQFAKETMLSCDACHTAKMGLTPLGRGFQHSSYRLMRLTRDGAPALALRGQAAYTSEPDPTGLSKLIVDEVDYLVAGQIAGNFTYFGEVYGLDGGRNGAGREAWIQYASPRQRSPHAFRATLGLVTLPLPLEPEAFRETNQHYAIWDQAVGANPFTFFDPHNALWLTYGNVAHGTSISALAVQARDKQSGLTSDGIDRMFTFKHVAGPIVLDAYRYDGKRPTGTIGDVFRRQGFGASLYAGRFAINAVTQSGLDLSPSGDGIPMTSSGGFLQGRYQIGSRSFAIGRYDGVEDGSGSFDRALTIGAGTRIGSRFRLEVEDVMDHHPSTKNTLNVVFGFAFADVGGSQAY